MKRRRKGRYLPADIGQLAPAERKIITDMLKRLRASMLEAQKLAEFDERAGRKLDYYIGVRDGLIEPPWHRPNKDGPGIRRAKKLIKITFPNGEERGLKTRVVRKDCERAAKTLNEPLPSADTFARAMGRRRK
jgi:hypothetical protein